MSLNNWTNNQSFNLNEISNLSRTSYENQQHSILTEFNQYVEYYPFLNLICCVVFWLVSPFWIIKLIKSKKIFHIRPSKKFLFKNVIVTALIVNEIVRLVNYKIAFSDYDLSKHRLYLIQSFVLTFSFLNALFMVNLERVRGLPSSVLLFLFWNFLFIVSFLCLGNSLKYTFVQFRNNSLFSKDVLTGYCYFVCLFLVLLLSCFADRHQTYDVRRREKFCPQNEVSVLSSLTHWWITKLIIKGNRRTITEEDLWNLEQNETSKHLFEKLEKYWNILSDKYQTNLRELIENRCKQEQDPIGSEPNQEENSKFLTSTDYSDILKKQRPSLIVCLFKAFHSQFLVGTVLKLVRDTSLFISPIILGYLINFIKNRTESFYKGYFYTLALFLLAIFQSISQNQYFDYMFNVSVRLRVSLTGLVYKKSMRLSNMARKESTVGEMVNIISVDIQSLYEAAHHVNMSWSCVYSILIGMALLWKQLGMASFAGLLVMFISTPFNSYLMRMSKRRQVSKLNYQDSRIKTINELLNGIKVAKFYAWETPFSLMLRKIRSFELGMLKKIAFLDSIANFSWTFSPFLVSVVSFGFFVFIDKNNTLNAESAFVSLALFNTIKQPMAMLPGTISNLIQANVSLERIRQFLLKEETNDDNISTDKSIEFPIVLENCSLSWDRKNPILNDLNLQVKVNNLCAVVGKVGCGKSSLLSAIIGEMYKLKGKINVDGRVAYAPQIPWIQNATIRENILFGSEFDETLYGQVVSSCCLDPDLELFPAGDLTEIGEKGINLSGGQKQRISLARCVYSNADIYLLDDTLSAVDSHVAKHIFDSVLGPNGMLKHKTRVLVTNAHNFLPCMDYVVLIENGQIADMGSFEQLLNSNGKFKEYFDSYESIKKLNQECAETKIQVNVEEKKEKKSVEDTSNGKKNDKIIEKEKIQTGNVRFGTFLRYLRACNVYLGVLFFILYAVASGFLICSNFWLSNWSTKTNLTLNGKIFHFCVYFFLGFLNSSFIFIADVVYVKLFINGSKNLHENLLDSILHCDMRFFESTPIGRILNRFSKDIESCEYQIPTKFKMFFRSALNATSVIIVISITIPVFLIFILPIFALFFFIQRIFVRYSSQIKRLESASRSPIFAFFSESLNGISTIRAFHDQNRYFMQMQTFLDKNTKLFFGDMYAKRWLGLRLELTGSLIILFVSFFVVLQRDQINAGTAGLSLSYAITITTVLIWMVKGFSEFETNLTAVERIAEYCQLNHEADWIIETNRPSKEWPQNGEVNFNEFSVKYRDDLDFVLNDISFNVKPKEKIGIVGRTGAGKSSLTLSLFRILENSRGCITIDGVDIKTIGLQDLRKKLTIIPQDPVLFSGTLRFNLDPFETYTDDEIWFALEHAHLKEFVSNLENKLEFKCFEGGENLSVGQRQLVCLARALLKKTKILVLDEATASIDSQTDELIQSTIRKEFAECTILTIAHRINTILDSDRIMVLDKGRVVEFDSPNRLLSDKSSRFYPMAVAAGLLK